MSAHVVILVGLAVCLSLLRAPLLGKQSPPSIWTLPVLLGYVGVAVAMAQSACRTGLRAAAGQDRRQFRRHQRLTVLGQWFLPAGLGGVLASGYSRWIVESAGLGRIPLADELAAFAPFVLSLVLGWLATYPCFRQFRLQIFQRELLAGRPARPPWTLREYMDYNVRHQLLFVLAPVGLILLAVDLMELLLAPRLSQSLREPLISLASVAAAGGVFLLAPLMIARIWRTRRLEDGPLREGLERMGRRLRVGARDILVWRTGGMIANAAVMGLLRPLRYVLISDMLLEHLDRRQVEAVFAHEATHIAQHHILYSLMFAFSSAVLTVAAAAVVGQLWPLPEHAVEGLALGLLAVTWAFGYGWISRRFERQSDVWSAWAMGGDSRVPQDRLITVEGAASFANALQRIAQLSGLPLVQRNWRHGCVAARIQHVLMLGAAGGSRSRIDRVVRRIKIGLWAAAALAAAALVFP